jgi:predicted nuclease of predicted toxin-antitoxin system
LKFLCDANIGSTIARAMSGHGYDVERAIHVMPDAKDEILLAYAVAQQRVLVTCDSDFGELVFHKRLPPPPAIIYIRFEPDQVADIVPRLMPLLDFDALRDHMIVIGTENVRRRPFHRER